MNVGNLLWGGLFLLGCGGEATTKTGHEQVSVAPEQERPVDEEVAKPEVPTLALATARAQTLIDKEASWTKAWEMARLKIAPCAPARQVEIALAPDSTHKEGEKYFTYLASGIAEYRSGRPMPFGTAVIKRTFLPSRGETTGYFLMMKEEGANPTGGDWLYATLNADKGVIRAGVLRDCASCHNKKSAEDFLFHAGR